MTEIKMSTTSNGNFSLLKGELMSLKLLIQKYVKVQLIKNVSFVGFVYAVDPITYSIILSVPVEDFYQTTVIPGHAILDVAEISPGPEVKKPSWSIKTLKPEDIVNRKEKLLAWFKTHLLPVTECNENIVIGSVNILPPYGINDICTENPIVSMQIKKLIEELPEH